MTTLAEAQAKLAEYLAAESALLLGKEVRLSSGGIDRSLKLEDLAEIRAGRKEWEGKVADLQAASTGVYTPGGLRFGVARFD